jgi:signal transduction histidine kinase
MFETAIVVSAIALLWVAYQQRIRQVARQFNRTLEARVSEWTRIARDLHDTLLQSLQGLLLRFQSASNLLPARPDEAKERLDHALDQAEAAITEGRDAVRGLRASTVTVNDLANSIAAVGAELTSDPPAVAARGSVPHRRRGAAQRVQARAGATHQGHHPLRGAAFPRDGP